MRAALISLPSVEDGLSSLIAGKTVCQRQLDFALACGCELVVLYGRGATPEALELRHQAESAGVRLQVVTNSHALVGVIGDQDSLLVLQPGLLPQDLSARESLSHADKLLIVAAEAGTRAGFERIDVQRAWAGAMSLPGSALAGLDMLPEDSAPAPALLRIALQQRLPQLRLPDDLLDSGDWQIVAGPQNAIATEDQWVRKVLQDGRSGGLSQKIAHIALRLIGGKVAGESRAKYGTVLLFMLLTAAGLAATWSGSGVAGFLLIALSAPVVEFAIGLARLKSAPFGAMKFTPYLRRITDIALVACGVLAIDSFWYRDAFAPLVLGLSLLLLDRRANRDALHQLAEPLRDRGCVAIIAAVGIAVLQPEQALVLVALAILALNLMPERRQDG